MTSTNKYVFCSPASAFGTSCGSNRHFFFDNNFGSTSSDWDFKAASFSKQMKCCSSVLLLAAAQETYETFKNYYVISDTRSCLMRVFVGPASTFGTSLA